MSAGWVPYNESSPFGREATVIGGDNIQHSKTRWEAVKAMRQGRATPEQVALVQEADHVVQIALEGRRKEK